MGKKQEDKTGQESTTKSADGAKQVTASSPAADPADPIGACFYVDADGRNRCVVTTLSLCLEMFGEFHPGKTCPDF